MTDKTQSDGGQVAVQEPRTKQDRINRLRVRLSRVSNLSDVIAVLKGTLDLLEDEL